MTVMSAKKLREQKLLYEVYLDLWYAEGSLEDRVEDLAADLKDARAKLRKGKKALAKVEAQYKEVHGRDPMKPKEYK